MPKSKGDRTRRSGVTVKVLEKNTCNFEREGWIERTGKSNNCSESTVVPAVGSKPRLIKVRSSSQPKFHSKEKKKKKKQKGVAMGGKDVASRNQGLIGRGEGDFVMPKKETSRRHWTVQEKGKPLPISGKRLRLDGPEEAWHAKGRKTTTSGRRYCRDEAWLKGGGVCQRQREGGRGTGPASREGAGNINKPIEFHHSEKLRTAPNHRGVIVQSERRGNLRKGPPRPNGHGG